MHRGYFWGKFVGALVVTLLAAAWPAQAQSAPQTSLRGHVPQAVLNLKPLGDLDGSIRLKLALSLPLRQPEVLRNLLEQLYDPASPRYHHYLTPDEFDAEFGPSPDDYAAVTAWATRHGFTITTRYANRMSLEVAAPVAGIEDAFHVTLHTYAHPSEARTFFAPDTDPVIDANVPVAVIAGLDDFSRPHPKNLHCRPLTKISAARSKLGSGPNGLLAGFDYRAAYAPGVSLTGLGQQVGLLEFDGFYPNDIALYRSETGVSNVPLQTILLDGFNGSPVQGVNAANNEVALDIEMAISMAPGLAKVVVFESDTNGFPSTMLQAMSTNTAIKIFSCSWDFGTLTVVQQSAMDTYFQKFAAQGQSFFDASGDYGSSTGAFVPPDDDPYITQVGGTTLATSGPGGPWLSEVVWNTGDGPGAGGSSGGVSSSYMIPAWQKGINMTTNKGSTIYRNSPDVAMAADDVFLVADNGQLENGAGTSASAPLWAGFAALANQQAVALGGSTIGFINPAIYHIGTNAGYTASFDDITVGNNTNSNPTQYLAVPGYDLCTGWGSPTGGSLINALTASGGFQITPGRGPVGNGPAGGPFTVTNLTLTLTNTGTAALVWSCGCTSTWLNVSGTGGTLSANGTASVTAALNSGANVLAGGVYPANIWFTNVTSGVVQLRQFTLQAGQNLVQDGGFEAGDFCYWTLLGNASIYTNNFVDTGYYTGFSSEAGNYFAALGQIANLAFISQTLPTRPGQFYLLSFWLENPYGYTPSQFQVRWNTNSTSTNIIYNQLNFTTTSWTNLQFVVQAATNATTLEFGATNYDFFALDNVSVLPVPAPALQAVTPAKGTFQLDWTALPGASYQLQYRTNLLQTNWLNLGSTITATANPMTVAATNGPDHQRFYRMEFVP